MRPLPLLLLLAVPSLAGEARVLGHDLELTLDPANAAFASVDRIRVAGPGRLDVAPVEGVTVEGAGVEVGEGEHELVVRFRGTIRDPVRKSGAATWVAGDSTAGTIGPEGSYLVRGYFVPSDEPCGFRVTVAVPLPHRAVSQGRRAAESEEGGVHRVTYETGSPVDGCVVVTGPWTVEERTIGGIPCRTYLYEQDREHGAILFSTLEQEIPRFQELFASEVPDGRFDVVENFFATGYGFPNFTLLGDTVIRYVCARTVKQGQKALPAGYLDHELVHCWLGNHLHVDYERGNWCEALTTYLSNYGAAEREDGGAEHRARVSRSFSLKVGPENDFPLREFRTKSEDYENDIGYGKGSMVFHMLARELGRDGFRDALRHLVATRGGRKLGWDDVVEGLGEGAKRDLRAWFEPWLSRKGAPVLEVGELAVVGTTITGTIRQRQEGPAYPLAVPVRVRTAEGEEEHVVRSASKESLFRIEAKAAPARIALDPDHHVFRALLREHVPPCLKATLAAPKRTGFGDEGLLGRLGVEPSAPALPADAAVLAIGLPDGVRDAILAGARREDASLAVREGAFDFRGETYDQPGDGILLSFRRPAAPGLPVTFFHGNGEAAYARTAYLPYYASESWVVFRDGRPLARGTFQGDRAATAEVTPARTGPPANLLQDLLLLTDPDLRGRRAGSTQAYQLANTLRGRLYRAGLKVEVWPPVEVHGGRVAGGRVLAIVQGDERVRIEDAFYPFHLSASPSVAPVFRRVVEHPAEDVKGALVLLPEDAPTDVARRYAEAGAAVVAVVSKDEALTARGKEAAFENALPPSVAEHLAKRPGDVAAAVSGMMARSWDRPLGVPYVCLRPGAAAELRRRGAGGVLEYEIVRRQEPTSNIVGTLGEGREPGVLLSAHWDGVGEIGGVPAPGAADNAAGVAVVLWVAEQLKRDHEAGRLKRPVVVALFGGEEAGLWGSRQFAQALRSPRCPVAKPLLAVNVDGVGSRGDDEVFLVGRSFHAPLLTAFEGALASSPLKLGKDIDRFAFEHGSDHWPLHQAGIPAVTVFSADYRAMNSLDDTLDTVDVAHLRELAKVVYRMVRALASE